MGVQRAFRRSRRAGRVDHHSRIVRAGETRREIGGGALQRLLEAYRAIARPIDRQNQLQARQFAAHGLGKTVRVGDQRLGAGVLQSIGDRLGAEQHGERQRDGAELVDRDVDRGDLGRLRQQDRDAVAGRDAVRRKRVGEPVRGVAQPAVADIARRAVRIDRDDRELARLARREAVAHGDADVELRWNLPAERSVDLVVIAARRQHAGQAREVPPRGLERERTVALPKMMWRERGAIARRGLHSRDAGGRLRSSDLHLQAAGLRLVRQNMHLRNMASRTGRRPQSSALIRSTGTG